MLGLSFLVTAPLTPVIAGTLLGPAGLRTTLWAFAGLLVVTVGALLLTRPLRRIGTPDTWAADAVPDTLPDAVGGTRRCASGRCRQGAALIMGRVPGVFGTGPLAPTPS